jgi:hypothetical protein
MKNLRKLSRRSFLARVAGGAVAGGAALTVLGGRAEALQITDRDPGDPANRTGLTDQDPSDRAGNAPVRSRACTDNDQGNNSDPAGRGRGNGVTDNDRGSNADRAGCGRGR